MGSRPCMASAIVLTTGEPATPPRRPSSTEIESHSKSYLISGNAEANSAIKFSAVRRRLR
jgi:hypothetical protein